MIRNPEDRIRSSFFYTRDTLNRIPSKISFSRYVSDLLEAAPMNYIDHFMSKFVLEHELDISRYLDHIEHWKMHLGEDNVKSIRFEHLAGNQGNIAQEVFNWLGLNQHEVFAENRNKTVKYRFPHIHHYLKKSSFLRNYGKPFIHVYKKVFQSLSQSNALTGADREAYLKLRRYFSEDTERLERYLLNS